MTTITLRRTTATLAAGALATTGLLGLSTATASAASAAVPTVRTVSAIQNSYAWSTAGQTISFQGGVRTTANTYVLADNERIYLQRSIAGGAWQNVTSSDGSSAYWSLPAVHNAKYRVYFPGVVTESNNYLPSYSNVVTTNVKYAVKANGHKKKGTKRTFVMKGKISPTFKGKVTLQYSKNNRTKWKKVKKVKVRASKFNTSFTGKNGYYRIQVPGNAKNLGNVSGSLYVYTRLTWR